MRSATTQTASLLIAAAITAAGSLVGSIPAHSAPAACTNPSYRGTFNIQQSNGLRVAILNWNGTSAGPGANNAQLFLQDGSPAQVNVEGQPVQHGNRHGSDYHSQQTGQVTGNIGGSNIAIDVVWDTVKPMVSNHYKGTIDASGAASGTDTNSQGAQSSWHINEHFTCAH